MKTDVSTSISEMIDYAGNYRGEFHPIFFLQPYSPHMNIAGTIWRTLKGKCLQPADYVSTGSLLYATNRALRLLKQKTYLLVIFIEKLKV